MSEQASFVNLNRAEKMLGKSSGALYRAKDFPPADEYMQGAGEKLTPLWRVETIRAYGESVAERRAKYDPTKNRK